MEDSASQVTTLQSTTLVNSLTALCSIQVFQEANHLNSRLELEESLGDGTRESHNSKLERRLYLPAHQTMLMDQQELAELSHQMPLSSSRLSLSTSSDHPKLAR